MDAAVLTLLGINVGMGFVYYALPVARYRLSLFQAIADLNRSEPVPENSAQVLRERLPDDPQFRHSYDILAFWLGELPDEHVQELRKWPESTVLSITTPSGSPLSDRTHKRYRWFKGDWDRRTCILVCSVVPIIVIWGSWFADPASQMWSQIGAWCAFIGQVWVAAHVRMGRRMVVSSASEFGAALGLVVRNLQQQEVARAISSRPLGFEG